VTSSPSRAGQETPAAREHMNSNLPRRKEKRLVNYKKTKRLDKLLITFYMRTHSYGCAGLKEEEEFVERARLHRPGSERRKREGERERKRECAC
jgi:hypothetical protein